ncbi:MAG TPA: precorrin-6y C5,15-methyltransferase (decarboxylating) subunit CbiE [Polyangiaceae bacterium]|nr:precorrin-6y C5,15-methyltransferase (decarboxylating) subunit CbiE [Polyangiaceae bacterium]
MRPEPLPKRWLSIVGLGLDAPDALSPAARAAIETAELVAGSTRQLELVRSLVRGERLVWPSPLSDGVAKVLARRGHSTCVLGSGDPFLFGIGALLAPSLDRGEFVCHPQPSSLSLAAARLGWPLQDTELVSLHGRDLGEVIRYLSPARRLLALSWNGKTPGELGRLLTARGFGRSRLHVLESLGGATERVRAALASEFAFEDVADLNLVGVEPVADATALVLPCRASLPDSAFEHDGQLTKQDLRAICLSALGPRPAALLWDVGAGAGSIGIEWTLSHPACRAITIERDPVRCARIRRNAAALGVPGLQVVEGDAPAALRDLAAPDAVFIGGGARDQGLVERCYDALSAGGRLVVNAVALETQASLIRWYERLGGELCRFSFETAAPLGSLHAFRSALPVTQWRLTKR